MNNNEISRRIDEAFRDPRIIQAAIARGIADAREVYAQAGHPMVTLKDGKVVWVDARTGVEVEKPARRQD